MSGWPGASGAAYSTRVTGTSRDVPVWYSSLKSMRAVMSPPSGLRRKTNRSPCRRANTSATCRLVTTSRSLTTHPVPTHS